MPMILVVVLILKTLCYYGIGLYGYIQFGCVAPENLMKSMSSPGWRYAALIWFWIHILLAFAVYLNPALLLFERFVFGNDQEEFKTIETPKKGFLPRLKTRLPSFALRTTVVVLQTFTAMLLQSSFEDLCDFAGASCLTLSAMTLPLLFYLKVENKASKTIRGVFYTMIVVCALAGCYTNSRRLQLSGI